LRCASCRACSPTSCGRSATPKGRALSEAPGGGRVLGAVVAALVVATVAALAAGIVAPPEAEALVPLSLVWAAINLVRLLAMLVVLWRAQPHRLAELGARIAERDGVAVLDDARRLYPLTNITLTESRLDAPSLPTASGLVLAWRAPSGRVHRLADVGAGGALRTLGPAARGRLLALLVRLTLDREPAYRPGRAVGITLLEMFGLTLGRRTP
jgi:hypothetical protein